MTGKCQANVSRLALTLSDGKIGFCYTVALENRLLLIQERWQACDFDNSLVIAKD